MPETVFVIANGSEILGQIEDRKDGIEYLRENYSNDCFNCDNYYPKCQGLLEEFVQKENKKFRIIEIRSNNMDILPMIKKASVKEMKRVPKPSKPEKNTACTPTRTRLITGKKTPPIPASQVKEGTVKRGNDGNTWISKKKGDGFKWIKYYEETHDGLERKRKAPKGKAKEFKVGTVKTGEDGKKWIVKKVKDNKYKWVRNN